MSRIRFSIRSLAICTAIAALLIAIPARELSLIRAEAGAVRELRAVMRANEGVEYGESIVSPESVWRRWLYRFAGSDGEVTHVRLGSEQSLVALAQRHHAF